MSVRSMGAPPKPDVSSVQLEEKVKKLETLVSICAFATAPNSDMIIKIEILIASFIESIKALKAQHHKYRVYEFLKTKDWNWSKEKGIDPRATHLILSRALKILDPNATSIDLTIEKLFLLKTEQILDTNKTLQMLLTKIISEKTFPPSLNNQRTRAGSLGTDRFPSAKKETVAVPALNVLDKSKVATLPTSSSSSTTSSPSKPSEAPLKNLVPFKLERSASLGSSQFHKPIPPVPSSPKPPIPSRTLSIRESKPTEAPSRNASFHSISLHSSPQSSSSSKIISKSEAPESPNLKNLDAFKKFLLDHIKNEKSYQHSLKDYGSKNQSELEKAFVKINTKVFEKVAQYLTKIHKKEYSLPQEISEREFILFAYLLDLYQIYLEPSEIKQFITEEFESPQILRTAISYSMVLHQFSKKVEAITFPPFSYTEISKLREKEISLAYTNYRVTTEGRRCVQSKFKTMHAAYLMQGSSPHPFETAQVSYFNTYSIIPDWVNEWLQKK